MTPSNTQVLNAPSNIPMRDVVLLHGWGINRGVWLSLLPYLPSTWRIHLLDLPGYAGSNPVASNRIEDWIGHLLRQAPERAVWVGWSLGATLALQAAMEFPDRIDKLCLISPTPRFMRSVGWNCGMDQASLDELWSFFQASYETGLKRFLMLQTRDRVLIRSLNQSIAQNSSPSLTVLTDSLEILTTTDLRNQLHSLQMPLQVVLGTQDRIVSPLASRLLAAHLQDVEKLPEANQAGSTNDLVSLLELEGGHLCFLEQQEAFIQQLVAFVEPSEQHRGQRNIHA